MCLAASAWRLGFFCWWAHLTLFACSFEHKLILDIGATVDPQLQNGECRWSLGNFPGGLAAGRCYESGGYVCISMLYAESGRYFMLFSEKPSMGKIVGNATMLHDSACHIQLSTFQMSRRQR